MVTNTVHTVHIIRSMAFRKKKLIWKLPYFSKSFINENCEASTF